jgi:predicted RNA-binding Zn ribbon-like protein
MGVTIEKRMGCSMLWDDFLNSDYHDWRGTGKSEDRLDKPGWLVQWLAQHDLPDPGVPSAQEIQDLTRLRTRMLSVVQDLAAGKKIQHTDVDELNRTLAGGRFVHQLDSTEAGLRLDSVRLGTDWAGVCASIAASFARTLTEGEPERLRICDNPDCLWVYYDETRNRSKRFCDDKMCGNLMKVRRFRARKKAEGRSPHGKE